MNRAFIFFLTSSLAFAKIPLIDMFDEWVDQFRVEFRDKYHFYDVLQKWMTNDKYIDFVNSGNLSYKLAHNQFSGMDEFDFIKYVSQNKNGFQYASSVRQPQEYNQNTTEYPDYVNWVEMGAVSPIKDQGTCGSCWAFSTTGALEGIYAISMGSLVSFSEQQLVDCDNIDKGCNGGLMDTAFSWVSRNGGLCAESEYPYKATKSACKKECNNIPKSKIQKYVDVAQSEESLLRAIYHQPVSVAIEADQRDLQLYKSGVFTGKCGANIDHGVLAVGYGTESSSPYYLVKNSWGTSWGDSGYIKLARGEEYNNGLGQCGILQAASYPTL